MELKEIISKQALYNIRFVSGDSSFTIYQKHTGGLYLSTNYAVHKILESASSTQFSVTRKKDSDLILISKKQRFHQDFNLNTEEDIFILPYGETEKKNKQVVAKKIGNGINPVSHLDGTFVTFYKPSSGEIIVEKLSLPTNTFKIKLPKSPNPFYRSSVLLLNEQNAVVRTLNSSGIESLLKVNFVKSDQKLIKKAESYQIRSEMCLINKKIYLFESNYQSAEKELSKLSIIDPDSFKAEIVYESQKSDLGNIACDSEKDTIYFLKNYSNNTKSYHDVAKLNIKDKKLTRVTNEDYITNIFEMDGRLIAVNNGMQMLLIGENSLKKDSIPQLNKIICYYIDNEDLFLPAFYHFILS